MADKRFHEIFESLPGAAVVLDDSGRVVAHNAAAGKLFGAPLQVGGVRCCDLVGCGHGAVDRPLAHECLTTMVLESGRALGELDLRLSGRRLGIAAAPLRSPDGVVLQARELSPVDLPDRPAPRLRIRTLGPLRVDVDETPLVGEWLHQRPGELLKYLICSRGHRVSGEELAEHLWPHSRQGAISVRQAVYALREHLEPDRPRGGTSQFILARGGGYLLDTRTASVDADEFESQARAGLRALDRGEQDTAKTHLSAAARLYEGDFLADEPYVEWVLAERDRLRALVARVLRELGEIHLAAGEVRPAAGALERVADIEPLDLGAQRRLLALMLRLGQHADAARRFELVRRRFRRTFDREPDFVLADLARVRAASSDRDGREAAARGLISDAAVRLFEERHGTGTASARTSVVEDAVVCLLEGTFGTDDRPADIAGLRPELAAATEDALDRRVRSSMSAQDAESGLAIEVFVLDRRQRG
jgi:DNA-binding SARP family transcriptional activator